MMLINASRRQARLATRASGSCRKTAGPPLILPPSTKCVVPYHVSSVTVYRAANPPPPPNFDFNEFSNFDFNDEFNDDEDFDHLPSDNDELRKVTYEYYPDFMPWDMPEDSDGETKVSTNASSRNMFSRIEDEETLRHVKTIGKVADTNPDPILDFDSDDAVSIPTQRTAVPRASSPASYRAKQYGPKKVATRPGASSSGASKPLPSSPGPEAVSTAKQPPMVEEVIRTETADGPSIQEDGHEQELPQAQNESPATEAHSTILAKQPRMSEGVIRTETAADPPIQNDGLEEELQRVQNEFNQLHGSPVNVNATKQVSIALFGEEGRKTTKQELLKACNGNDKQKRLANLVLKYRAMKSALRKRAIHVEALQMDEEADEDEPLLLLDTSGFVFRAYHSLPQLNRSDGMPSNAVRGFCSMIFKLVKGRLLAGLKTPEPDGGPNVPPPPPPRLILVFDAPGPSFRKELYPDYKGNRPQCPADLQVQFQFIREAARAFGIPQMEAPNYEADDVIATLTDMASKEGIPTRILSSDKDLMQLITPKDVTPRVDMMDPKSQRRTNYKAVEDKWGVAPGQVGDLLALIGDTSDNVPGVKGVGIATAKKLLDDHGNLDNLLDDPNAIENKKHRKKLVEGQEAARLSRKLVDLVRNVPIELPANVATVGDIRMEPLNVERLMEFYERMEFKNLAFQLAKQLNSANGADKTEKSTRRKRATKKKTSVPKEGDWDGDMRF